MSERLLGFLEDILQRHFGSEFASWPRVRRADVEELLTDDSQRRLAEAERAALEWGHQETGRQVEIAAEHMMVTPRGLLYAAELGAPPARGSGPRGERLRPAAQEAEPARASLHYIAAPRALFQPIVDRVEDAPPPDSVAAVDARYGHELEFPWPLDARLRRSLDAHEVLVWF